MPELPDLQVFSSNLNKALAGNKLKKITIENKKKLKNDVAEFKDLEGEELKKVYREGKELYFEFGKNILAMHLMLRGQLFFFEKKNEHKYTIIELLFDDDSGLALTDFQGAANAHLNPKESDA